MSEPSIGTVPSRQVIPGTERHIFRSGWLDSRQSFPVTGNFDLAANAHGVLLVHNDDRVDAGEGFDAHFHRDAEIITWVLEGAVAHRDSFGNTGTITPGVAQRMSAGREIGAEVAFGVAGFTSTVLGRHPHLHDAQVPVLAAP